MLTLFACSITALVFFVIGVASVARHAMKADEARDAARADAREARANAALSEQRLHELAPELYPFPAKELL